MTEGRRIHWGAAALRVSPRSQVLTSTPAVYDGTGVWAVDIGKP
ncbi:hypothetical protein [Streptomyces sp. NBC_00079]